MRVKWRLVGMHVASDPLSTLPETTMDMTPRPPDSIDLPNGESAYVRSVNWYPWGEIDADPEPFVYIVVERYGT